MRDQLQQRLNQQQQHDEQQRQRRLRDLEIKVNRCISEVSWRFFPSGGYREIDIDAAEQLMHELFATLRDLRQIDRREGDEHGPIL